MKYDVVLVEKRSGDGLSAGEIVSMTRSFLRSDELIPIEIDSISGQSSAMGFVTKDSEQILYGEDPDGFERFIGGILADVTLEKEDHTYAYAGQRIWLDRTAPDCYETPPRIEIPLSDSVSLVAEQNCDRSYKEIYIGIEKTAGVQNLWWQDLAVVREAYTYEDQGRTVTPVPKTYEVLVYGNADQEDWTEAYQIPEYEEEQ